MVSCCFFVQMSTSNSAMATPLENLVQSFEIKIHYNINIEIYQIYKSKHYGHPT